MFVNFNVKIININFIAKFLIIVDVFLWTVFSILVEIIKYSLFFVFFDIRGPPRPFKLKNLRGDRKMDKRPIRRKTNDNPYILESITNEELYFIVFKDVKNNMQRVKVNKDIFNEFNLFELQDIKQLNEYDRHIEHSVIYENNIETRSKDKRLSIEDELIRKSTFEDLKRAIDLLPEIQKRRIKKYYFEDKTEQQIADEENTTQQSVHIILERAIMNLRKNLKNF